MSLLTKVGGDILSQELNQELTSCSTGQEINLFSLLANTFAGLEDRRMDLTSVIAVLSLYNLFSILSLVHGQGLVSSKGGGVISGVGDLAGLLSGLFGEGRSAAPEFLVNLLQKQVMGKKLNPQLLSTLLSLAADNKGHSSAGDESGKSNMEPSAEKRTGRGIF